VYRCTRVALAVGANSLFKLKSRNHTNLVQKPNWTELAKSPCIGVHIFTIAHKSRPIWLLVLLLSDFEFSALNKGVERTVWGRILQFRVRAVFLLVK
jgi:hypothetical protein